MTLKVTDDGTTFLVQLEGSIAWNDRLVIAGLAGNLRGSLAAMLVLDGSSAVEGDRGAFDGLASTVRRLALLDGLEAIVIRPAGPGLGAAA